MKANKLQCDEIWSFAYCERKNVATAKATSEIVGHIWTWTALDSDSKVAVLWLVGDRSGTAAIILMDGLPSRLDGRVQLAADGHNAYLDPEAVEGAFGGDIDYAMLV